MNRLYRAHCCLFDRLLSFQSDDLLARYGDEMRAAFRDELQDAWQRGATAILRVWSEVLAETITLTAPRFAARLRLVLAASVLASGFAAGTVLGFCALEPSPIVHACSQERSHPQGETPGSLVRLPTGQQMFLECSGDANTSRTPFCLISAKGTPVILRLMCGLKNFVMLDRMFRWLKLLRSSALCRLRVRLNR